METSCPEDKPAHSQEETSGKSERDQRTRESMLQLWPTPERRREKRKTNKQTNQKLYWVRPQKGWQTQQIKANYLIKQLTFFYLFRMAQSEPAFLGLVFLPEGLHFSQILHLHPTQRFYSLDKKQTIYYYWAFTVPVTLSLPRHDIVHKNEKKYK